VHLTEDKLHEIAKDARSGLRDCLKMIELHVWDSSNAFLNPGIVVTAVATWERLIVDTTACVLAAGAGSGVGR
jgi:hypothetical protein